MGQNSRICSHNLDQRKRNYSQSLGKDQTDVEEEFILQMEMEKLMIDDFRNDDESSEDEVSEICTIPAVKEKKVKQGQITDFFSHR